MDVLAKEDLVKRFPNIRFELRDDGTEHPYFPFETYPRLSPKQNQFITALASQKYSRLYYGGAVGGGKTYLVLSLADQLCKDYPGIRIAVIRKTMTALKRNTINSYYKVLNENSTTEEQVQMHKTSWVARYANSSMIDFVDADTAKDKRLNKLRGLEVTLAIMEEANECERMVNDVLLTRIGRWKNVELGIKPCILYTSNPDVNWVKQEFYDRWKKGTLPTTDYYLPALPADNPFLDAQYIANLELLPPDMYAQFALGDWDYVSDNKQLIKVAWADQCAYDKRPNEDPLFVGIDFAREGKDFTSFSFFSKDNLLFTKRYKEDNANKIADYLEEWYAEYPTLTPHLTAVDAIGNGASLIDVMAERGQYIGSYKGSEKASKAMPNFAFFNTRMEANWMFREALRLKTLGIPYSDNLWKEIQVMRYHTEERSMHMELRKEILKILGKSPDEYDSVVIGNYVRVNYVKYGKVNTSYIKTKLKNRARNALGKRKYLSSVQQMIY